ncbi:MULTISPECIES: acyltransferase family protein [Kitasatospora]|uniref:Acyltransferase n=1 Tax=Kitasatospora cystarginea TaxID=58350 RepID=A0ABN3DNJ8_9ACTN
MIKKPRYRRTTAPVASPLSGKPRLAVLDGLRLVAALMVVLYHYTAMDTPWNGHTRTIFPSLHHVSQYAWIGVEVFFLISGFVICMSSWGKSLGDFVVSRASRLYPAYWAAVVITAIVISLWPQVEHIQSWAQIAANLTMLQDGMHVRDVDGVYWTLFTEMKFYLLFALLVVTRGVNYRNCVLFCGVWTVIGITDYSVPNDLLDMWAMPLFSPYFIAGIALYLMYRFKPNAVLVGILVISFLLAENEIVKRVGLNLSEPNRSIAAWPAQILIAVAFAVMTLIALGKFDRIQWRWLTTAGALTYPLYLLHENIGWTIIHTLKARVSPVPLVVGTAIAMMVLAWLLHRIVERPLGRRFRTTLDRAMTEMRQNSLQPKEREVPPPASEPHSQDPSQRVLAGSAR